MAILESKEDKQWREFLSWIAGKKFKDVDGAFEWLGIEAKKLNVDPHKYMELLGLLAKTISAYDSAELMGAGLPEFLKSYNKLKEEASDEFPNVIRTILVGLQMRFVGDAISVGGEKGFMRLSITLGSRMIEQILFGDNQVKEFPWREIIELVKEE
ncbi:MAG: hypothetical protein ACE5K4_01055 [Candidatus Hydrothermarchaeota archaeon]